MTATRVLWVVGLAAGLAWPGVGTAQTVTPRDPRSEVAITAGLVGPVSFGGVDASLTRPSGSPLVLFTTENRLAPGVALEVHLGQQLTPRLMVEASGAWNRANFETAISGDVEDAESVTLAASTWRVTVEGAVLWTVVERGALSVFARGGAGWMRELAGSGVLVEDGIVGSAGAGVKYWFVERPTGRFRRVGIRVEGRAAIRSAALTLGESKVRLAPVVVGGVVFRF